MNMSSRMSGNNCRFTAAMTLDGDASALATERKALRHMAMSKPAGTPFPETSAMATPNRSSPSSM